MINRQNRKWFVRFALILLLGTAAEVLIVLYASKPLPWVSIIPGFVLLFVAIFIIVPMSRAEKR
jgi:membrane protein YdbS with pleckstrin-like domain